VGDRPTDRHRVVIRWPGGIATAWAAVLHLPHGLSYAALTALLLAALWRRPNHWPAPQAWRVAGGPALVGLLAWFIVAMTWSDVAHPGSWWHLMHYLLAGAAMLIASAVDARHARLALLVFVWASLPAAALLIAGQLSWLPAIGPWKHLALYGGNKSIVSGVLLVVATGFALCLALDAGALGPRARTSMLYVAGVLSIVVITCVPARTALISLPVVIALAWLSFRRGWRQVCALAVTILLAVVLAWHASPNVQERFSEGLHGLANPRPALSEPGHSWDIRAEMYRQTARMVAERPWTGHGVGSWPSQWRDRSDHPIARNMTTPHNEFLSIAAQVGLPGAALFLAWLLGLLHHGWRGADAWHRMSLVLGATWIITSAFNVALRDAVFALPLLMLTGLLVAATSADGRVRERHPRVASMTGDAPTHR